MMGIRLENADPALVRETYTFITGSTEPPPADWGPDEKDIKRIIRDNPSLWEKLIITNPTELRGMMDRLTRAAARLGGSFQRYLGGDLGLPIEMSPSTSNPTPKIPTTAEEFRAYVAEDGPTVVHFKNTKALLVEQSDRKRFYLLRLSSSGQIVVNTFSDEEKDRLKCLGTIVDGVRNNNRHFPNLTFATRKEGTASIGKALRQIDGPLGKNSSHWMIYDKPPYTLGSAALYTLGAIQSDGTIPANGDNISYQFKQEDGKTVVIIRGKRGFTRHELAPLKFQATAVSNPTPSSSSPFNKYNFEPIVSPGIEVTPTEGLKQFTRISVEWFDYVTTHFASHPDVLEYEGMSFIVFRDKKKELPSSSFVFKKDGKLWATYPRYNRPLIDPEKINDPAHRHKIHPRDVSNNEFLRILLARKSGESSGTIQGSFNDNLNAVTNSAYPIDGISGKESNIKSEDGFSLTVYINNSPTDDITFAPKELYPNNTDPYDFASAISGADLYRWLNTFVQVNPQHPAVSYNDKGEALVRFGFEDDAAATFLLLVSKGKVWVIREISDKPSHSFNAKGVLTIGGPNGPDVTLYVIDEKLHLLTNGYPSIIPMQTSPATSTDTFKRQPLPAGQNQLHVFYVRSITTPAGEVYKLFESKIYPEGIALLKGEAKPEQPVMYMYTFDSGQSITSFTHLLEASSMHGAYKDTAYRGLEVEVGDAQSPLTHSGITRMADDHFVIELASNRQAEKKHAIMRRAIVTVKEMFEGEVYGENVNIVHGKSQPGSFVATQKFQTSTAIEGGYIIRDNGRFIEDARKNRYAAEKFERTINEVKVSFVTALTPGGRVVYAEFVLNRERFGVFIVRPLANDTTNWEAYHATQKLQAAVDAFNAQHRNTHDIRLSLGNKTNSMQTILALPGRLGLPLVKANFGHRTWDAFLTDAIGGNSVNPVHIILGPQGTSHPYKAVNQWDGREGLFLIPNTAQGALEGVLELLFDENDDEFLRPQKLSPAALLIHGNNKTPPHAQLAITEHGLTLTINYPAGGVVEETIFYDKNSPDDIQRIMDQILAWERDKIKNYYSGELISHRAQTGEVLTAPFRKKTDGLVVSITKNTAGEVTVNAIKLQDETPDFIFLNNTRISISFPLGATDNLRLVHQTNTHILATAVTFNGTKLVQVDGSEKYLAREFVNAQGLTLSDGKALSFNAHYKRELTHEGNIDTRITGFTVMVEGKNTSVNQPQSEIPRDGTYTLTLNTEDAFIEIEITFKDGRPESITEKLMKPVNVTLSTAIVHSVEAPAGQVEVELKNTYDAQGNIVSSTIIDVKVRGITKMDPGLRRGDVVVGSITLEIEHDTQSFDELITVTLDPIKQTLTVNPEESLFSENIQIKAPEPAPLPVAPIDKPVPASVQWTIQLEIIDNQAVLVMSDGNNISRIVMTAWPGNKPISPATRFFIGKNEKEKLLGLLAQMGMPINYDALKHNWLELQAEGFYDAEGKIQFNNFGFAGITKNSALAGRVPVSGIYLDTRERQAINEALKGAGDLGAGSASGRLHTPAIFPTEPTLTELAIFGQEMFLPTFETLDAITAYYNAVIAGNSEIPPLDRLEFYSSDGLVLSLPVDTVARSTGPYNIVFDEKRPIQTYVLGDRDTSLAEIAHGPWVFNRGGYPLFFELKGEPGGKTKGRKAYEMHLGFYKDSYKDDDGTKSLRTIFPFLANVLDEYGTKEQEAEIKKVAQQKMGNHLVDYINNRKTAALPNVHYIPQQKVEDDGKTIRLIFASRAKEGGYQQYTLSGFSYNRATGFMGFEPNLKLEIKHFSAFGAEVRGKAQVLTLEHGFSDDNNVILLQDANDKSRKFTWNRARRLLIEGHPAKDKTFNEIALRQLMRTRGFYTQALRGDPKYRAVGEKEAAYVAFDTGGRRISSLPADKQSFVYPTKNIKRLTTAAEVALLFEQLSKHDIDLHDEVLLPDEGSILAQTQIGRDDEEFIFVGENVVARFLFEQENNHPYRYLLNPDANPLLGLRHGEFLVKNPDRNADGTPKNGVEFYAIDASLMISKRSGGLEREHLAVDIPGTNATSRRQFTLHRFGNTHVHSGRISFGFQIWDKGKTGEGAQAELIHWQKQLSVNRAPDFLDKVRVPGEPIVLYDAHDQPQFNLDLTIDGFNGEGENCFIVRGIEFDTEGAYLNYFIPEEKMGPGLLRDDTLAKKFRVYQMGSADRSVLYLKDEDDKWYLLMVGAQGQVWLWNSPRELREFLRPIRASGFTNTGIREKYAATSKAYATRSLSEGQATITLSLSQFTSASRGALASGSKPRVRLDISKTDGRWKAQLSDILAEEQPTSADSQNPAWPFNNHRDTTQVEIVEDTWTDANGEQQHGKMRVILKGEIKDADGSIAYRPYCVIVFKSAASILDGASPLVIDYTHYHKDFKYVDSKLMPDDENFLTKRAGLPIEKEIADQEQIDWDTLFLTHDSDSSILNGLIAAVRETDHSYATQAPLLSALHMLSEKDNSPNLLFQPKADQPLAERGGEPEARGRYWAMTRDETGHFIYSDAVIASLAEYVKKQIPTSSSTPSGSGSSGRGAVLALSPPQPVVETTRIQTAAVVSEQSVIPVKTGIQVISDDIVGNPNKDANPARRGQYSVVPASQQAFMYPVNPITAVLGIAGAPWTAALTGQAGFVHSAMAMGAVGLR